MGGIGGTIIAFILGLFKTVFEVLINKPYKVIRRHKDVAKKGRHKKNPDDMFSEKDW